MLNLLLLLTILQYRNNFKPKYLAAAGFVSYTFDSQANHPLRKGTVLLVIDEKPIFNLFDIYVQLYVCACICVDFQEMIKICSK